EDLKKFVNAVGSIKPKVATGNCAKHQRKVTLEVKRARLMALLPFAVARIRVHRSLVSAPASQNTKKVAEKVEKEKAPGA
ncbi:30S ribosomal protein S18, partial [Mycoplasmopsis synoviae]|uniref:30S ribosomal protein S18 n=1 Tax=Mycoplasmopsis synoviae TaxID=2109 RepID=UPI00387B967B